MAKKQPDDGVQRVRSAEHRHAMVICDVDKIESLRQHDESEKAFARRLDVSGGTLRNMMRNEPVKAGIVRRIAVKFNRWKLQLISRDSIAIDVRPEFYEGLKHGYYVTDQRMQPGDPAWHHEYLRLRRVPDSEAPTLGLVAFSGTLSNQFSDDFNVSAFLMDRHNFTMLCFPTSNDQLCFSAVFTRRLDLPGHGGSGPVEALSGIWSSVDISGRTAMYQIILAKSPIDVEKLKDISFQARLLDLAPVTSDVAFDPAEVIEGKKTPPQST